MKIPSVFLLTLVMFVSNLPAQINTEAAELKKKLSGTFWKRNEDPKGWVSLNADGTATAGWHPAAGSWEVVGKLKIILKITSTAMSGDGPGETLQLDAGLTKAGHYPRINPPTQTMLNKVAGGFSLASPNKSPTESPTPTPGLTISPELQESASAVVKANHDNFVFVTGKEGSGSGFIANLNGTNYLITNAHVAVGINHASFKSLSGTPVETGKATVAVGEDIFRMEMPAGGQPFEVMQGVDQNAGIGDDVVVLGNAEGGGVINTITGKIVGVGPNLIEISAPFVPDNSGSPIVHLKTGKVIGVATYYVSQQYDATTKEKMKAPVIRRFGYRIDSAKTWQPVNWQTFYVQAAEMKSIETFTEDLGDFFRDLAEHDGTITPGRHTNPIIKNRIEQWFSDKKLRINPSDAVLKNRNFLSFLKFSCQADVTAAQRHLSYDYFLRELATEQATRNEMSKGFEQLIKSNE